MKILYFFNIYRYNFLLNKKENKKKVIVIFDKFVIDWLMLNLFEKRSWFVYIIIWIMKMVSKKCFIILIRNMMSRNILVIVICINLKIEYRKKVNDILKMFYRVRKKKLICFYNICLDNLFVCFLI